MDRPLDESDYFADKAEMGAYIDKLRAEESWKEKGTGGECVNHLNRQAVEIVGFTEYCGECCENGYEKPSRY